MFVFGYSSTRKGYKCFNPATNKIMMSRVVKFEESIPFFHKESTGLGEGETWADLFPLPNSSVDPNLDLIPCNVSYAPASEHLPSSLPLSSCDASQSHEEASTTPFSHRKVQLPPGHASLCPNC